jgi:hypothetical protein
VVFWLAWPIESGLDVSMDDDLRKVYFELDADDWHGCPNEGLWAEPIKGSVSGTVFCLRNSPFFARDVSFLDTVRAVPSDEYPGLKFAGVIDRGGHSTYMLLVPPAWAEFEAYWQRLEALGCTYESTTIEISLGRRTLYTVDVPGATDVYAVYRILEEGQKHGIWMFQEGHVGHPLKD